MIYKLDIGTNGCFGSVEYTNTGITKVIAKIPEETELARCAIASTAAMIAKADNRIKSLNEVKICETDQEPA
jgi:hypothetical protein